MKVYNIQYLFILVNNYVQDGFLHFMISSNELCKPEQKVKVFLHLYKVQVYKGIEQGYQVSIRAITKTCATQSNFLHPLLSTMPRAKQAKAAEPKKRLASTKWISEEEVSPKKAKVMKDSDKDKDLVTKLKTKPGVLDKCVFCFKSGVRTLLDGAGSATNMRFVCQYTKLESSFLR